MTALIPRFAAPGNRHPDLPPDDLTVTPATDSPSPPAPLSSPSLELPLDVPPEPPGPARNGRDAIRTLTSSPGEDRGPRVDPKIAGRLAAVVVGGALLVAGWVIAHRRGILLRQPTEEELARIGDPLGRIAGRHLPANIVNADLLDAADAAEAAGRYVKNGPLLLYVDTAPDSADPAQL